MRSLGPDGGHYTAIWRRWLVIEESAVLVVRVEDECCSVFGKRRAVRRGWNLVIGSNGLACSGGVGVVAPPLRSARVIEKLCHLLCFAAKRFHIANLEFFLRCCAKFAS